MPVLLAAFICLFLFSILVIAGVIK